MQHRSPTPEQMAAQALTMKRYWDAHPERLKLMVASHFGTGYGDKEIESRRRNAFAHGIYLLEMHWASVYHAASQHRKTSPRWMMDYEASESAYVKAN